MMLSRHAHGCVRVHRPVLLVTDLTSRCFSSEEPKKRQAKVKRKKKRASADATGGRSKELNLILASLDAPTRKEGPISEAEKARRHEIGRNYVIGRFEQHNDIDHDLTCKLHLKKHAIRMLPPHLKESALKITTFDEDELSFPPSWRSIPVWTPPIPGFDPSEFRQEEDE